MRPQIGYNERAFEPKWRNWQTQRTQNPSRFTSRVGSTPTFGTNLQPLGTALGGIFKSENQASRAMASDHNTRRSPFQAKSFTLVGQDIAIEVMLKTCH